MTDQSSDQPQAVRFRWIPFFGKPNTSPSASPSNYVLTRWLFLRGMALIYFFAFASVAVQINGLIGSHGILPAGEFLSSIKASFGVDSYRYVPTLLWLDTSDRFLSLLVIAGTLGSILAFFDVLTAPVLAILWVLWLSLVSVGQDFLAFQWDYLLLEVGFLTIFFAPWHILPRWSRQTTPSVVMLWLLRLVLFRLMFGSGIVKILSGDPTWNDLSALSYHYFTQPLPTPLAWYAQQLPEWVQKFSTAASLFIEIPVPFLIFAPRRARMVGAALLILLQLSIAVTGNFAYFNWLTIVLCVTLFDDQFLRCIFPTHLVTAMLESAKESRPWLIRRVIVAVVAVVILIVSLTQLGMSTLSLPRVAVPRPVQELSNTLAPFGIVNSYALFVNMTTTRPEIIVEGSSDGTTWLPYEFKYKPGDPNRMPPWVAPHQPRLDWQMWFAALSSPMSNPWFSRFLERLKEGAPNVLALLAKNPFSDTPPRYVRATLYNYTFTDLNTRQSTGAWWQRTTIGPYAPVDTMK
ncbi:MAG: lipase maturation factor family protein [Anaerolineae bacterium]|nr:lipase maturation factor family protein [Anaerolineae bacterium]